MSPYRNRVTPTGEIVAIPLRGAWTGNRGRLHEGEEVVRFHGGNLWITCALEFRGRHHDLWRPGRYTFLFFHDEAVAFAAGHRPCAECRWGAYKQYQAAWASEAKSAPPSAGEMNRQLHSERLFPRTHRRRLHEAAWASLPDGAFTVVEGRPALVLGDHLSVWGSAGYGEKLVRPRRGTATVLTPPSTLAVLRAGYPVQVDEGAL